MRRFRRIALWAVDPILAAGLGALAAVAQPPSPMPLLGLASIAGAFLLWRGVNPGRAFLLGWAFGAGFFSVGLHWVGHAFMVDAANFAAFRLPAVAILAMGLALFWGAGFWLAARLRGAGPWSGALAFTAAWAAAELARGHVLTGFPWGLFGYAWIDSPLMPAFSVVGAYGLTFLTLLAGAWVGAMVHSRSVRFALTGAAMLATIGAGVWSLRAAPPTPTGQIKAAILQPNVPQHEKVWSGPLAQRNARQLLDMTEAAAAEDVTLILWPESAPPVLLDEEEGARPFLDAIAARLRDGQVVVTGIIRAEAKDDEGWRYYNSAAAIDSQGRVVARYDKRHLVPFGEYLPFSRLFRAIGFRALAETFGSGYTPGEAAPPEFLIPNLPPAAPLICYEAVFPEEVIIAAQAPEWIFHLTNDSWFGASAGPYQHLAQSQARAAENGLPIVRAASTGVSAHITWQGKVAASLGLGETGTLFATILTVSGDTVYRRLGDWPLLGVLIILLCGLGARRVWS